QLAQPHRRDQAGEPGPGDRDHFNENVGLCSTYSIRTRSGPQRNAANVFAASTTDSTSMPVSPASATTSSAESTSTAMWLSSGRSLDPGSPACSSTNAPPPSTLAPPAGAAPAPLNP